MSDAQISESANIYRNCALGAPPNQALRGAAEDEKRFVAFAASLSATLGAIWAVRILRKAQGGGA